MAFEKKKAIDFDSLPNVRFGRTKLYCSVDELNANTITTVLKDVLPMHFENVQDIEHLTGVYKGVQQVLAKTKKVRKDINNKILENNAFRIVEFSKGYVFGEPIQYVQKAVLENDELELLNKFMGNTEIASKNMKLGENWYINGQAYKMVLPKEDADKPFDIFVLNPSQAFVVYDSGYEEEPQFACYIAQRKDYVKDKIYYILTVYSKENVYTYRAEKSENKKDEFDVVLISQESNFMGDIPIVEYALNDARLGKIEVVETVLNALNQISSNDVDDIEQFVNSLLVFINAQVNKEDVAEMSEMGAVNITSEQGKTGQADVKLLINKLLHSETKVLYDRLYNNMLTIVGVPTMANKTSSGDTGQAKEISDGWTMADARAKQDELAFKFAEKRLLGLVLKICKQKSTGINALVPNDIEIKFTRNKSDNLLVKTQALMNLKSAQVAPEQAFGLVGLFNDASDAVKIAQEFYGEEFWKEPMKESNAFTNENLNTENDGSNAEST
jgi:SPP1 family phage portal protein